MISFILTLLIMLLAIAAMAVGVLLGRRALRGSCGGDAVLDVCPICEGEDEP